VTVVAAIRTGHVGVLAVVLLAAYLVAVWAMAGKPQ
jgi:hypothetical protein